LFLLRLAFVPSPNSHHPIAISRDRSRVIESIFLRAQEMPRETEGFACGPGEVVRSFLTRGDPLMRDFHARCVMPTHHKSATVGLDPMGGECFWNSSPSGGIIRQKAVGN